MVHQQVVLMGRKRTRMHSGVNFPLSEVIMSSAPSEAWRFLPGASPGGVRSHQPRLPRVASGEEATEPNEPGEAATGPHVDRKGDRTP
jgi:hypothetical protein